MAIQGSYLVLKVAGDVIAETTNVSLKMISKQLEHTSQGSGINAEFTPGLVKIGLAGSYLYASSGANWNALYSYLDGGIMSVALYLNDSQLISGEGVLRKLGLKGADESSLITGSYGIRYYVGGDIITTEDGFWLTTEDGKILITE